ncbi:MAG: acetylxylan esterase [Ginsengibacter sp.]
MSYSTVVIFLLLTAFAPAPPKDKTVVLIGNGNMAEQALTSGERGWAQMLPMYFGLNVHFNNYAIKEKSAEDFFNEGNWNTVLNHLNEGDYVFLDFTVDETIMGNKETFQKVIKNFIADINKKKAVPVLFSPAKKIANNSNFIRAFSASEGIIYIDLESLSKNILEKKKQTTDDELTINEAAKIARIAAQAIKAKIPQLEQAKVQTAKTDVRPAPAFGSEAADIIATNLRHKAALDFDLNQLPITKSGWDTHRKKLREDLLKASGAVINHSLPLDIHETGKIQMNGYTIRKIFFQTRPGVYATANLYVPDGKGVFPAIINMHGHWLYAKAGEMAQPRAHELALNGYVCLSIDAWGAGERTTLQDVDEYHGSNLGASLMNIGESLLGNQLSDNIRGVDLLCSLSYVDKNNIGATGASGGGNQTMWLSALDERIKASMPVVSVGTFQSYIMGSNCVCELMPEGLTFSEESGILALVAPRSIKVCNGLKDMSPTFAPAEMLRSYTNAKPIFALYQAENNLQYQLFNTPHGYWPEMRQAMLGWFDLKLKGKGNGDFKEEIPFHLLKNEQLMVFPKGDRSPLVSTTVGYCIQKGEALNKQLYENKNINTNKKLKELSDVLLLPAKPVAIKHVQEYDKDKGWQRIVIETNNNHLIPLKYFSSSKNNVPTVVICSDSSKDESKQHVIDTYIGKGYNVAVADIWGTGEGTSAQARAVDGSLPKFHTLARAELWLGTTIMAEWIGDINNVIQYIQSNKKPSSIILDVEKEIAIAALIQSALNNNVDTCILRTCPVSYTLDKRENIDFFNMAIHVPGILNWGDVSLMAVLNKRAELIFEKPVSITGKEIRGEQLSTFKDQLSLMGKACKNDKKIIFL